MTETDRLVLQPLTYQQLVKYIRNDQSLEEELGLQPSQRAISPELKEALEETILPNVADSRKNYRYATLWTLISKEQRCMVEFGMLRLRAEVPQAVIKQAAWPEAALHRIADKLEQGQMQLARDLPHLRMFVERLPTAVAGDGDDAAHGADAIGYPEIELHVLALAFALLLHRVAPLLVG